MAHEKILVVDDEEDILELLRYNLEKERFTPRCVTTGEEALSATREWHPDLIILDLMLPGIGGLDVCRVLKGDRDTRAIPVVMLTAKGEESDIVIGLELGADDYIVKPFSPRVLMARMRAVLRRRGQDTVSEEVVTAGSVVVDPRQRIVTVDGVEIALTATEFGILYLLVVKRGWVLTRNQIIEGTKGDSYPVTDRAVDVHIVGLRRKLGEAASHIETVRGVGYRFRK